MLEWVNDRIIDRTASSDDNTPYGGSGGDAEANKGTIILDATCAPQNIRFPTDASLLNEARENAEEIVDILHENGDTDGKKPRTYQVVARKAYNGFSKSRKKTHKTIRNMIRKQLGYLRRDLALIQSIEEKHPGCLDKALPQSKIERMRVLRAMYEKDAPPKSALGKALHYLQEQWPYLIRYFEDGRLELSNNRAEQSFKPFVMGRKNFLLRTHPAARKEVLSSTVSLKLRRETGWTLFGICSGILSQSAAKNTVLIPPGACRLTGSFSTTVLRLHSNTVLQTVSLFIPFAIYAIYSTAKSVADFHRRAIAHEGQTAKNPRP